MNNGSTYLNGYKFVAPPDVINALQSAGWGYDYETGGFEPSRNRMGPQNDTEADAFSVAEYAALDIQQ